MISLYNGIDEELIYVFDDADICNSLEILIHSKVFSYFSFFNLMFECMYILA